MILNVGGTHLVYKVVLDEDGEQSASDDIALDVRKPDDSTDTVTTDEATTDQLDFINTENARNPDWTDLTSGTGVYVGVIDLDQSGNWWGRWSATDPLDIASEFAFYVYPQRVVIVEEP